MFDPADRPADQVCRLRDLERAGLELVFVPESYGYDAMSIAGHIAALTRDLQVGTGIVNVYSRSPALLAMSAATIDALSGGRFILGLGASGAQVIEGFHGVSYENPVSRLRECTQVCRMAWRREPLEYSGKTISLPLGGPASGRRPLKLFSRPVRPSIPIWWGSVTERSVEEASEHADGWITAFFVPEKALSVWGDALRAGQARRDGNRAALEIAAGGIVAIGDKLTATRREEVLDLARPKTALYVGGMGTPERNFYNDLCRRYGYEEAASVVKQHFLAGDRRAAERAVPLELLELSNFVGPAALVRERVRAFRAAGVTTLVLEPVGEDKIGAIEAMRSIVDDLD